MNFLFARGDVSPAVYRIDLEKMSRRYLDGENLGVLTAYQQNGGILATIPQAQLDNIVKEAGSR